MHAGAAGVVVAARRSTCGRSTGSSAVLARRVKEKIGSRIVNFMSEIDKIVKSDCQKMDNTADGLGEDSFLIYTSTTINNS